MEQVSNIPVKDPHGKIIGKASIEHDGQDNYHAKIVLDHELGYVMMKALAEGTITGLSVGAEIHPVMKKTVDKPVPDFFQGRAEYGKGPVRVTLPPMIGNQEIDLRFGHHKASIEGPDATAPIHEMLRSDFRFFAQCLDHHLPAGREKDIAFERLEDTSMWSHKAIARISAGQER